MIEAVIFDLDGTLLQTEKLKALSYARAAVELCPYTITEDAVIEAFHDVVGLSRHEVALALMERFHLEDKARQLMAKFGVQTPWQAFIHVRLHYYEAMLSNPDVIRENQWPHSVALLKAAKQDGCKTALATMSHCEQVRTIFKLLDWDNLFDFVATREDVEHGKPNPEIYNLVARELKVSPQNCLVIEDSPVGVEAALRAKMHVIAVSTAFTREKLHADHSIDPQWIVDDPATLPDIVEKCITAL